MAAAARGRTGGFGDGSTFRTWFGSDSNEPQSSNSKNEKVVAKTSGVYSKDVEFPSSGVDDMTKLAYLHEPGVLQNLRCRYEYMI
ncbi:hypothetical protein Dsin_002070 [Dipteronia sinensis]|uniref:Myosin motor domain-containing protein n=1 Tax=Dipteronia sinensis TaxID=43782 RepID=A0AAE0B6J2_9ROSI|nr:hypothetical protein Dsin_002070 [Dipteronia sinensis]